jgi:hypothetical protein
MHIASIGIDLGRTTSHLVALGDRSKALVRKKFSRTQLLAHTRISPPADWPRGVFRSARSGGRTALTRSQSPAHPCPVREALPKVEQERLS